MPAVQVRLEDPINGHEGKIDSLTVRPPTGGEYLAHGDPEEFAQAGNGVFVRSVNRSAVREYAAALTGLTDAEVGKLSLVDVMALEDAIMGFFRAARERRRASGAA